MRLRHHHFVLMLSALLMVTACAPATHSDRYGIRHFAGRWTPASRTHIGYLNGSVLQQVTDTPGGYLHLEVDRAKDANAMYVDVALMGVLDMLGPLADAQAFTSGAGEEESAAFWDWGLDGSTISFIGNAALGGGQVVTSAAISGLDKDGMTLTYTEVTSDSTYFEEILVLDRQ